MPFLTLALAHHSRAVAVDGGDGTLTYRELAREAEGVARRLVALGVGPGDVVALKGDLDEKLLAGFHGVWKAGATVAPLHSGWTKREETRALVLLSPKLLLEGGPPRRGVGSDLPPHHGSGETHGVPTFSLDPGGRSTFPPLRGVREADGPLQGMGPEGEAAHLMTSGTGGDPTKVALTVGNLLASARGSAERLNLLPSDRWLASLSPAHVGGLAMITRAPVVGSTLVLRGPFRAATFNALAVSGGVSHASLVPTMLHRVLDGWGESPVPDSLRCLLIGGGPASEELIRSALDRGFPLFLTYGLTQASSQVATASPALSTRKPGTVGPPLPGIRIRIADSGELLVKGPTVSPGSGGEGGWFRTGDLAREDADGDLWITGRISDRIISGGVNVDPGEIETVLAAHPEVEEVAVVGIPDLEWGERVVAAVVLRSEGHLVEGELDGLARSVLSGPMRPKAFRVVESLPRNANGKVRREQVRELFR